MPTPSLAQIRRRRIVLIGHPNVGKSVLFNALTGRYVTVSNYPGTTVDLTQGLTQVGEDTFEVVDSPGVQSLVVQTEEEAVTRSLLFSRPDIIVQVSDAKNLTRALALTLELADLRLPMVLCLNMSDEARQRGVLIRTDELAEALGIPVVETTATRGEGLAQLRQALTQAAPPIWQAVYAPAVEHRLMELGMDAPAGLRPFCPLLLQNTIIDPGQSIAAPADFAAHLTQARAALGPSLVGDLMEARQHRAEELAGAMLGRGTSVARLSRQWAERLGRWTVQPWPGYFLAAFTLWALYKFVGVFGAKILVDLMEGVVFGRWINPAVTHLVQAMIPWRFLQDMLIGPFGVVTMALTYAFALILPIVSTFFFAMGVLEDSGYLPRLSVLLDRFFRLMGLNGKAVFPMILGLGCGTMAMLSARILDSKKERFLVSFLLALAVPCSAQLGVVLAMTSGISSSVLVIWLAVVIGSLLGVGFFLSKVMPGTASPFILELPPMRVPQWKNLLQKISTRLRWYLKEVVPLFVLGTLLLYVLDAAGWLKVLEHWASPIITTFLGLPEKATDAFLIGFLRRDYGAAGLYQLQRANLLSLRQTAVSLVAITLFMPCIAQVMMCWRERGWRATVLVSTTVVGYALLVAGIINRVLMLAGWA